MADLADKLRRLHEEATPGPWADTSERSDSENNAQISVADGKPEFSRTIVVGGCGDCGSPWVQPSDRALIATLRNALPALVDLIEAVERDVAFLRATRDVDETKPLFRALAALRAALEVGRG